MTAQLVMTPEQIDADRDAWLKARTAGITASEIAQVLGIAPGAHGSPFALYHAKLDGVETGDNDAMMRGRYLEPYVDQRFAAEHPYVHVLPGGLYRHPEIEWMMATFDRLGYEHGLFPDVRPAADFPIQIKTAGSYDGWGDETETATIPVHYRAQTLWEMEVWGADEVLVPVLFIVPWRVRTYRLTRDMPGVSGDIELMVYHAEAFRDRLEHRDPPPVDWTPATTATLRALHPSIVEREQEIPVGFARKVVAARKAKRAAEKRLALLNNQLRDRMGDAHYAVPKGSRLKLATRSISDAQVKAFTRHNDSLLPGKWGATSDD